MNHTNTPQMHTSKNILSQRGWRTTGESQQLSGNLCQTALTPPDDYVDIRQIPTCMNTLFFYKRLFYKRHEPEICQNFKNKIRQCPG